MCGTFWQGDGGSSDRDVDTDGELIGTSVSGHQTTTSHTGNIKSVNSQVESPAFGGINGQI